jgi:ABC-type molybdate transport system permease subunit
VLCFARALGEFGATRMVSLNTADQRTLALEIYRLVETPGDHTAALLRLVAVSLALSALALGLGQLLTRRWSHRP